MSDMVPLRSLLGSLGAQLHRLAEMGSEIEDAVGQTIGRAAPTGAESGALQKLDNLVQSLGGLAAYVELLTAEIDEAAQVDARAAVAAVNQKSLAAALSGHSASGAESGSADFF